jgi:hypothetical protein
MEQQAPLYYQEIEPEYVEAVIWEAPEYFHREKNQDWFWGLAIITVTLVVLSIILGNPLFGIFIAIAGFAVALFAHRPPRIIEVEMGPRGIRLEKNLYHFSELESFWIREEDLHPKVLIKSKRKFMPYIIVPLGDVHHDDVRDYLLYFLKEEPHNEPFMQRVIEYFGF